MIDQNYKNLKSDDFIEVSRSSQTSQIMRPSLSYWQDAWNRLKKNKQAMISFYIVHAILLSALIGPFVWRVDPSAQDLNRISQGPSFNTKTLVIDENSPKNEYSEIPLPIDNSNSRITLSENNLNQLVKMTLMG